VSTVNSPLAGMPWPTKRSTGSNAAVKIVLPP
jgi:hypothetical protein